MKNPEHGPNYPSQPSSLEVFQEEMGQLVLTFQDHLLTILDPESSTLPSQCQKTHYTLTNIHACFEHTSIGTLFREQSRFKDYKPDWMDARAWEQLLGQDVNNHHHGHLTFELTKLYARSLHPMELTHQEEVTLLITALVHDWAESIRGDIQYNDKTKQEEAAELDTLALLFQSAFPVEAAHPELYPTVMETIDNPHSRLGEHFHNIEHIGYLRTALRAWRAQQGELPYAFTPTERNELQEKLRCMIHNVIGNILSPFIAQSAHSEFIWKYLRTNQSAFSHILSTLRNTDPALSHYRKKTTHEKMLIQYAQATQDWQDFLGFQKLTA